MAGSGRKGEERPERRCILSGESGPREAMIRFVRAPDGTLTPDLAERLPGRGIWIRADRDALLAAVARRRLAKAAAHGFKAPVRDGDIPPDLGERLDRLLRERVANRLGLEYKAGRLVTGFEKVRERLRKGRAAVLVEASDGAEDGRRKLRALAGEDVAIVDCLDRRQLGLALGRENVVHAAVDAGGGASALLRDCVRLAAWKGRRNEESGADGGVRTVHKERV